MIPQYLTHVRYADPEPSIFGEWEPNIKPSEITIAPCRTIPVTDEMRARDAEQRRLREIVPASAWTIKASLNPDELRKRPKSAPPEPGKPKRTHVLNRPPRFCSCGTQLDRRNKSGACVHCCRKLIAPATKRRKQAPSPPVAPTFCSGVGCKRKLRPKGAIVGLCYECLQKSVRAAKRKPKKARKQCVYMVGEVRCTRILSKQAKGDKCTYHIRLLPRRHCACGAVLSLEAQGNTCRRCHCAKIGRSGHSRKKEMERAA